MANVYGILIKPDEKSQKKLLLPKIDIPDEYRVSGALLATSVTRGCREEEMCSVAAVLGNIPVTEVQAVCAWKTSTSSFVLLHGPFKNSSGEELQVSKFHACVASFF